jgi:hypothetical protein
MVSEYTVPWVAVDNPNARSLAWIIHEGPSRDVFDGMRAQESPVAA